MSVVRIKWDEDEVNKLAEYCARERLRDIASTLTELLDKAQNQVLPEGRRRPRLASYSLVKGFDRLVKEHTDKLVNREPVTEEEKEELTPEKVLENLTVNRLVDIFLDKVFIRLQTIISANNGQVYGEKITERFNISTGYKENGKVDGPVIGVVGMYIANFRALENRLHGENVRLKFFDGERKPHTASSVSYFVCVPNKLPHTWQHFIKDKYGDNAYIVKGRVKEAEKVIRDIVKTGKSTLHY